MMRVSGGAVVVAVAAFLVCCSADPHQGQEHNPSDPYNANGHKTKARDPPGGGRLARQVRDTSHLTGLLQYMAARRHNSLNENEPFADYAGYYDLQKRNFDEIDRSDLNPFVVKRNFDEIDQTAMPFPLVREHKRFSHLYGNNFRNFDEMDQTAMPFPYQAKRFHQYGNNFIDNPVEGLRSSSDKKRLRPDYPMDEIDLSNFPIGGPFKRSFDSFGREGFRSSYDKKRLRPDYPMDEIDLSNFPISKRSFDSIGRPGLASKRPRECGNMDEVGCRRFLSLKNKLQAASMDEGDAVHGPRRPL